jgi:signal recognition particle subunit SRP54
MLPIPGLTREMREMISQTGEGQLKKVETIVNSMTREERRKPNLISAGGVGAASRVRRIAAGCGLPEEDVRRFLQQFEQMRMLMTQFSRMMGGGASPGDTENASAGRSASGSGLKMPRSQRRKGKDSQDKGQDKAQAAALAALMRPGGGKGGRPTGGFPGGFPGMPGGKPPRLPKDWKFPPPDKSP